MSSTRIGMVRCEHCGRQFNPHSAARHIPWCEKQRQERNKHRLSNEKRQALERYKWRISYRPSNQMNSGAQIRRQTSTDRLGSDKLQKKSSVNSSATLSSPSASSSASMSIASVNDGYQHRVNSVQRHNQHQQSPRQRPTHDATRRQLQRSISSLTLTKRQDLARPPDDDNASDKRKFGAHTQRTRTKSTNDLSNMGEMVEILARRVDEIYAQNQLLLASIPKGSATAVDSGLLQQQREDSDSDDGSEMMKCHHCKANCLNEANYCHKCGCKLRLAASPQTPD